MEKQQFRQSLHRKLVQIAAFGFTNSHLGNLAAGKLYTGPWKNFCSPGLNCYSCPAASFACPIGALQAVASSRQFSFSFYVTGFLLAVGVVLGRAVCGWFCPFGFLQDLLARIPVRKFKLPKTARYLKYAVLALFVLLIPALATNYMGMGFPAFCQYLCPAGTLEGGLPLLLTHPELRTLAGPLLQWKVLAALAVLIGCLFVKRFFCKALCPLGAIYGLLNKVSLCKVTVAAGSCVSCGSCAEVCPMDVDPTRQPSSAECIRCGKCAAACPTGALHVGFRPKAEQNRTSV